MNFTMPPPEAPAPPPLTLTKLQAAKLLLARGDERAIVEALANPHRIERLVREAIDKIAKSQHDRTRRWEHEIVELRTDDTAELMRLFCAMWDRVRREENEQNTGAKS